MMYAPISANANVNTQDEDGQSALMYAASIRAITPKRCARLRARAAVNAQDDGMWTALMYAVRWRDEYSKARLDALLAAGANPNMQDNRGFTAPMLLAEQGGDEDDEAMVRALLDAGADVNAESEEKGTARF